MYATKLVITTQEFDTFFKKHLSEQDLQKFADSEFIPLTMQMTPQFEIEITVVPVK